ncbi:MAG: MTH1187 family thiamine-binding protein [Vicinamibacterales bacterium]
MKVMVDVSVVPLGVGLSLSPYIAECERIFQDAGLKTALHAYGTNIEGEWDEVFTALRRCHERLHAMGVPRITASLRVGTRTDRTQSIEDKVRSVQQKLDAGTS